MCNPTAAVIMFPGSNCDHDALFALKNAGFDVRPVWHDYDQELNADLIFIPGGFSYGDYLRAGALAKFSKVMNNIKRFVDSERGLVIGVCNGFQILTEAGILPGALSKNKNLKFICQDEKIEVVNKKSPFTKYISKSFLTLPIAHSDGRYVIGDQGYESLESNRLIAFKYSDNPNGSMGNIAGILNHKLNVLGMMPHPERNSIPLLGNSDGLEILLSVRRYLSAKR